MKSCLQGLFPQDFLRCYYPFYLERDGNSFFSETRGCVARDVHPHFSKTASQAFLRNISRLKKSWLLSMYSNDAHLKLKKLSSEWSPSELAGRAISFTYITIHQTVTFITDIFSRFFSNRNLLQFPPRSSQVIFLCFHGFSLSYLLSQKE